MFSAATGLVAGVFSKMFLAWLPATRKESLSATFLVLLQGAAWNSDLNGEAVMTRTGRYMHFLIMQRSWDASLTSEAMM